MKRKLSRSKLGFACVLVLCLLLGASQVSLAATKAWQWDVIPSDLVLLNGKIITVDEDFSIAEALAVKGNRIVAVGRTRDIEKLISPTTKVLDLQGKTVIPGMQDSHIHFLALGWDLYNKVNLMNATTVAEVQKLVGEKAAEIEPGKWVEGLGWDWMKFQTDKQEAMANRLELDVVTPNNPVHLNYVEDGWVFNTLAMKANGYDENWEWWSQDPPWTDELNYIERFTSGPHEGVPTGVFYGATTIDELRKVKSPDSGRRGRTLEENTQSVLWGQEEMFSCGVVSVVDPGLWDISPYQEVYNAGELKLRVTVYSGSYGWGSPESDEKRAKGFSFSNLGDDHLRWRGAKFFADGGIGSMDGALSVPYEFGAPENYGSLFQPDDVRLEQYRVVADNGWELHTHFTGDRSGGQVMRLYDIVLSEAKAKDPNADLRYSTIHNFLAAEPGTMVVNDLARLGVVAMVNSIFYYDLGDSFRAFIGDERIARFCAVGTMMEAGVIVAEGSDYPICQHDPWKGMFAMVTRIVGLSRLVWGEEQRVSVEDALKTYTINGAYLTYEEDDRGSLETGKYADLVVLNKDILTMDPMELETMKDEVLMTLVDGKVVWESPKCNLALR